MAYTKRWELMHILGGGCVNCGNQNFGALQIDHIYNDGYIDRNLYTDREIHYTNNPLLAKQRLQLLCKACHKKKHAAPIRTRKEAQHKMRFFMDTLRFSETVVQNPVPEERLIINLTLSDVFEEDEAREYIRKMLRQAAIYESKPGHYNCVPKEFVFNP